MRTLQNHKLIFFLSLAKSCYKNIASEFMEVVQTVRGIRTENGNFGDYSFLGIFCFCENQVPS